MSEDNRKAFLQHFPATWMGAASNRFYDAARTGLLTPKDVCSEVWRDTKERCAYLEEHHYQDTNDYLMRRWLVEDPEGALEFAAYVLDEEKLRQENPEERARHKKESAERGKDEWKRSQKPSDKQLAYLRALGCPDVPANMQEASEMIDAWKRGEG